LLRFNTETTMKRLLPILLLLLGCAYCSAEVKYSGSHRGYHYILTISIVKENGKAFLDVLSMDRRRTQIEEPKMLIKLMNDSVIALEGKLINSNVMSRGGVVVSNIMMEASYYVSEAKYPISPEQISQFGQGIKKLRLNTSPYIHEKEWKKDKIGKKLYEEYLNCSPNSFEDKF